MSYFDFRVSQRIADYPFAALIMAAMWKADSTNAEKLRAAFPDIRDELLARYRAPGGQLPAELAAARDRAERQEHAAEVRRTVDAARGAGQHR